MTQYGPITMQVASRDDQDRQDTERSADGHAAPSFAFGPQYTVCRLCIKRYKVSHVSLVSPAADAPRCECGARLHDYEAPLELSAPARGVLPRLIRFWRAGREDGYWDEKRFFRPAAAERAGVSPRQVRFAYESGRRAGERLRAGAHLHALRVMKMKGAAAVTAAAVRAPRQQAAA